MPLHLPHFLSVLMVLVMLISAVPTTAFATDLQTVFGKTEVTPSTEDPSQIEDTQLLSDVKSAIDGLLTKYLGSTVMSQEDVTSAVIDMNSDTLKEAWKESKEVVVCAQSMSDDEFYKLGYYESTETFGYFYSAVDG